MTAFDCTYLTATLCQFKVGEKKGLVGGTWLLEKPDNAFVSLTDDLDIGTFKKSTTMLETLLWDPSSKGKHPLSICSVPIEHNWGGGMGTYRGCMYMLHALGTILKENDGLIRGLVFDGHGTHQFIKKLLHGQVSSLPMLDIASVPFFGEIRHRPLPPHSLPRFPIELAFHGDEVIWALPGVCFSVMCDWVIIL